MAIWPVSAEELLAVQLELARPAPGAWRFDGQAIAGACFVCFSRGKRGDTGRSSPAASGPPTSAVP